MCGIIGYCGERNAVGRLIAGLKTLEYRGYDSAGVAVFTDTGLLTVKSGGRIADVERILSEKYAGLVSRCGIGHTRWATHGEPNDRNAHPHSTENVSIVHNGIIENYRELRDALTALGYRFLSDTDSETIAVLLDRGYTETGDERAAIRYARSRLRGSYAVAAVFAHRRDVIYAFRKDSPLIAAQTPDGAYLSSDFSAVSHGTDSCLLPEEGEILVLDRTGIRLFDEEDRPVERTPVLMTREQRDCGKGRFPHYMLKEIFDSPSAVRRTVMPYMTGRLPDLGEAGACLASASSIYLVACGTALNAGKLGKLFFEGFAAIPTRFETASEFRYYPPLLQKGDVVVFITQSGETADTLAAMRMVKSLGLPTVAMVNTPNSTADREADRTLYTRAGTEIAVASTKAYTAQAALLYLAALDVAQRRRTMSVEAVEERTESLCAELPVLMANLLADCDTIRDLSRKYCDRSDCFFIGRGADFYLAEESSLKLKEVSYIHSEAYAAGELKHGTIALIETGTPVVAIASGERTYEKTLGNIREVKSRGARVLLVTDRNRDKREAADDVYTVPCREQTLFPLCAAVFFQLFAYYGALERGGDVDKPRNLAKSVTVE